VLSKREAVDVGGLVRDVIELLAPPSGVAIEVSPMMPVLEAERVPLQQVFMNLIGNAVKYAGAGRAHARVTVECRDVGDAFEFAISDDGPGIAPEYHERIWGIFQTLDARDKVEGTGIGLSVVKKIVETRGGRASVESAPGQGATFRFSWPKAAEPSGVA
jgi:signal transduction histidine kinase